ncbi:MAG: malate synthase G, partial [Pseudomonadota bacterium]|nr:malate synthase G [Pseudomonadota bacterium]
MIQLAEKLGMKISTNFVDFIEKEVLPNTNVTAEKFWHGLATLVNELTPQNKALLDKRRYLQKQINEWHELNSNNDLDLAEYKEFLYSIGYLVPKGEPFSIDTDKVDPEVSQVAGPQLVVPVMNARFALNAANARWGSLYDALYGTDSITGENKTTSYDTERGKRVIEWGRNFLDETFPLNGISWKDATLLTINNGSLCVSGNNLKNEKSFVGYSGKVEEPNCIVLRNNNLHVRLEIDPISEVGSSDLAGISDIILESAISTIMDCEDSIAAVDASDKIVAYRNWLGLMKGDLSEKVTKKGKTFTRTLNEDFSYKTPSGEVSTLKGTSLMLVRNVGHLMTTPTVLDQNDEEVFEGLLDALCTVTIALHDVSREGGNSSCGSIYVVKPKMHGPEEVEFACRTFSLVEEILGLPLNTVKIGIMDEERRTSVNLFECIRAAKSRVA